MFSVEKHPLPKKVRLNGSDCFHLVLDQHARKYRAGGNVMRQVFYLSSYVSLDKITHVLKKSPLLYWLCNIKLVKGSFLQSPYWLFTDKGNEISIAVHQCRVEKEVPTSILDKDIAITAAKFISVDVLYYPSGKSALVFSWNHILLDGKGTALLFQHLNNLSAGVGTDMRHLFPVAEQRAHVLHYIKNMYEVKRFIKTSSKSPISSVTTKLVHAKEDVVFKTLHFTEQETKEIEANAFASGARFGINIYQIACCLHAVNELNKSRGNAGTMWLPIPYDGRIRGSQGPTIGNQVSYLFYRIDQNDLGSLTQTVASINSQMKDQLGRSMPKKYDLLLRMMRRFPLPLYYYLVSRTGKGTFSSFLYTTTGENFSNFSSFLGEPVQDIAILPAATVPPGLTFIFVKHGCSLNLNIAFSPDVLRHNEWDLIEKKLKTLLVEKER
jgi:NRPS condensation-like uncharacterized protein